MTRIIINTKHEGPTIAPEIYGQFAEHLGHCIYEGIYVGEDSPIPNTRGLRNDVVQALKDLKVPVLRWPGGCFADEYHWKDGIGPKDQRKPMVNSNWGGVVENNHFGTHEFMDLCEQIDTEAYVNMNLGSGTVQEMQEWVEYLTCNNPASSMAQLRAQNGHPEAWKVRWIGIGNENWGCGGNMCPDFYAQEYKRYQTFVRQYGKTKIERIACGANNADYGWTESLMRHSRNQMDHLTLHKYSLDGPWDKKGTATGYNEDSWYRLLSDANGMDDLVAHHLSVMDRYDPDHRIGLIVDEWGSWHEVEKDTNPGFLYQQNTIRDALLASLTLDIFHRYAGRITMANIAQMVNVLQAMILTKEDQMVLTPTYHVFKMYQGFQGATYLSSWHDAAPIKKTIGIPTREDHDSRSETRDIEMPSISLSAARGTDGRIYVAITNLSATDATPLDIELTGIEDAKLVASTILKGESGVLDSHNDFDHPDTVTPTDYDKIELNGNHLTTEMPAAALILLTLEA